MIDASVESRKDDRSSQGAAKIILTQSSSGDAIVVVEPIVGVEDVIAQIIECSASEAVRS
jgi:hypothetical protein